MVACVFVPVICVSPSSASLIHRQVAGDTFRYLTCGDCEIGPIGITFDADNNKVFYVSHDRVLYG